ncbi:cilia- and flagella-associated protein 46 [Fundulus heteroclitus]|uniref:cilia- and flagella-associated protein 46 n=1 Tax=Fundulus heteroclitus TaxID=8078 RepID=UPI00165C67B7|nr:cilia- and flagella-associated protein 46 [Fundulus heteroclitus]
MELDIREHLAKAKENQDLGALHSAYSLIKGPSTAGHSGALPRFPPELYVLCAEHALQLGLMEMSSECLKMYFEGNPQGGQFLCRALLCQGQLKSLLLSPASSAEEINEAVMYFLKAIEMSKKEPSTHFLVFNASVLYLQTAGLLLQPGRCLQLVHSLKQVLGSLEEVADQDLSWRAELMIQLVKCHVYSGQVEEAASFARVTENFIKSHAAHLYPRLYTLQVQHKLSEDDVLLETSRQCITLRIIYKIQELKNRWKEFNENTMTEEDCERLKEIFSLLVDSPGPNSTPASSSAPQSPTPVQLRDRVALLLELALLSSQGKRPEIAADCLKQLKLVGEVNIDQRIIMECVNCEINLLKKEAKMNDYSKASVEARLKEIDKLDQWLEAAVREGGPQARQAVCVTQWKLCLPLLQHNLRKRIRTPLLKLAQVLEDMQSLLLEVRCGVHSELAAIEEEEGDVEASLSHLQKALLLDNGTQRERLSSAFQLLQLRRTVFQTPACPEDKAAMLMQQIKDMPPQHSTDRRPILVSVGLLLAPDDFQTLLDADDPSKFPAESLGSEPIAYLAAKARHHSICVEKLHGYLDRQRKDKDDTARVKLWATLAKTARKQDVWDVCRAACRFCLFYDDRRWTSSETKKPQHSGEESCGQCSPGCCGNKNDVHVLRLLAEICFINAEATLQKLLGEGLQLNSPAVPPLEKCVGVTEEDPRWVVYRDWIQALSAYATSSFLRGGELGVEIGEPWLVENAAIYLWNYNSHMLAAGEYQLLLPTFQNLVEMIQKMNDTGNRTLCVMLCDAVARGLIQPLSARDFTEPAPTSARAKSKAERGTEQASGTQGVLDPAALQDVQKALELCNYALHTSSCHSTGATVPVAVRKQVLTTWVQIKRLLHEQIGSDLEIPKDESENEEVVAMNRVLVGLEMLHSNKNPRHMEFSVPSLSALAGMASECSWSDAVVELQVWCQLAAFCHHVKDHSLVLRCTQRALQLEEAAAKSLTTMPCSLYGQAAVNEMLSSAACLRGWSLVCESSGNLDSYREALKLFLSGVSFAEKADNRDLCVTAAGHFWNACLPLTQSPRDRRWLKENLEKILKALIHTSKNDKHGNKKGRLTFRELPDGTPKREATKVDQGLCLRAAIVSLLVSFYNDSEDFAGSLQLLDKAISSMPRSKNRLLLKSRVLLKARMGECITRDMQMLQSEGGQCCSTMWHRAALCAVTLNQQLTCYQNAITSLLSTESEGHKVNLLLEFGAWLYYHNFTTSEAQLPVQYAIDILLHLGPEKEPEPDGRVQEDLKREELDSSVGVYGRFTENLSSLKEVRRLDQLIGAHTLLAAVSDRTSPEHQNNLLLAYTFVLQIWQVSVPAACEIFSEMLKNRPISSPPNAGSKKSKDKGKDKKVKEPVPTEERQTFAKMDKSIPSTLREWARYICPEQTRQIFRTNNSPHCINKYSFINQKQSLFYLRLLEKELRSLSLYHLTLPILHLAEVIAHDLLERQSLSDLYRLRIVSTCAELGFDSHSSYQEKLQSLSKIQEFEQMRCHKDMILSLERRRLGKICNQKAQLGEQISSGEDLSSQDIWLQKAEVCLGMGLYQSARQLLAEALMVARELGDETAETKSLLSLAALACQEHNYAKALILLDKAQILGGDYDFWYHFTLVRVTAVVGLRDRASQTKVDQIIKQGCEALQLIAGLQVNRLSELRSMIASLENRGAVECIRAIAEATTAETFSPEDVQRLKAACDTLRVSAAALTRLNYGQQAAEAHRDCAHGLRLLGKKVTDIEEKHGYLLDGLSQMQLAVALQEHVVLSAQRLFVPQESCDLSLQSITKLLHLRVGLIEFCLEILEELCAQRTHQAFARSKKTSTEIALEEFTRSSPRPNSTEMEWQNTGRTLGQTILCQLAAVNSQSLDNVEIRARCLSLMGKYLRLLAVQEEPMYVTALWHKHNQEAWSDSKGVPTAEETSQKLVDSSRKEPGVTSARSAELQRKDKARQLLAEASKALSESISLCLQHKLPSSILAEASLNMLECHGQSDPTVTGQYLALCQSCCTIAMAAEVLSSACTDTSVSQLCALISLHRNLLLSQERRPSSMLKGVEDSLLRLSKAFSQLTISPDHLNILSEIPPNLKILLLQHSDDGTELYGGFYETTKAAENLKAKTSQLTGPVTCSQVAKVSVCPRALVAVREPARGSGRDNKHSLLEDESGQLETSEEATRDAELKLHFRELVEKMENYLNPLLSQFDFSFIRCQAEMSKSKIKEEQCVSDKVELGDQLVVLADRKLLELPLEALPLLRQEGLTSVSRDFSLQLFFSRLSREETQKVESDNKKETKGGKGTKGKGDQSQAIKAVPANLELPPHTFAVDTSNLQYIVDPYKEGHFEGIRLRRTMKEVLENHRQHLPHLWEGFISSKDRPSVFDVEQILSRCSALIYMGTDPLLTRFPPAKLAGLNLTECHMALLFDPVQSKANVLPSNNEQQNSAGQLTLERPLETALLLSLSGVGCIVLNQWHSTPKQEAQNLAAVLDNILRVRQTSGQAIHALRGLDCSHMPHYKVTGTDDQSLNTDSKEDEVRYTPALSPTAYNCILYGLPNLIAT